MLVNLSMWKGSYVMQCVVNPMSRRSLGRVVACAGLMLALAIPARAEVLATATYDTDSYVFFGTNSVTATEITLGEPFPQGIDPHYNIGFIKFDVSGLSLAGSKYLQMEANTTTGILPSTVRVAQLYGNTDGYFAGGSATDRVSWLYANAFAQPAADSVTFTTTNNKRYADITVVVNNWINDPSSNHGLALWRVGGADFDSPEIYSMNDLGGRGPVLNSVPEPGTFALGATAIAALAGVGLRRRKASLIA
jgi:hypothetical protein